MKRFRWLSRFLSSFVGRLFCWPVSETTYTRTEIENATGATKDDLENWIRRGLLGTKLADTRQGVPRRFTRLNAVEIALISAWKKETRNDVANLFGAIAWRVNNVGGRASGHGETIEMAAFLLPEFVAHGPGACKWAIKFGGRGQGIVGVDTFGPGETVVRLEEIFFGDPTVVSILTFNISRVIKSVDDLLADAIPRRSLVPLLKQLVTKAT